MTPVSDLQPTKKIAFNTLPLHPLLQKAIKKLGFSTATPIQSEVLPITLSGKDTIGKAQTGTGKTAAFLISIINDLLSNPLTEKRYRAEPRALILAPTRELAQQIQKDCEGLIKGTGLHTVCILGGVNYDKQDALLDKAFVDIMVATPGRLIDGVNKKQVWLDRVELFVLDEADRMMDMGFIPDIKRIIRAMPAKTHRQSLLFSATFNQDVMNLAYQWLYEPEYIEIEPAHKTNQRIEQRMYLVSNEQKQQLLLQLLGKHKKSQQEEIGKAIVFANRRDQVNKVFKLLDKNFKNQVVMLSGEMSQSQREKTLKRFKNDEAHILVATDVAGRGIHVDNVSHVINYTLPDNTDDYVHRIGRTGRAGCDGISISFASEDDAFILPNLEEKIGEKFKLLQPDF